MLVPVSTTWERKLLSGCFDIHQSPGLAHQWKVESQQQPRDSETLGRASQSVPRSFRPGIVCKRNPIQLSYLLQWPEEGHEVHWPRLTRWKKRRSHGCLLPTLDWPLASSRTLQFLPHLFSKNWSKGTYIILWKWMIFQYGQQVQFISLVRMVLPIMAPKRVIICECCRTVFNATNHLRCSVSTAEVISQFSTYHKFHVAILFGTSIRLL